MRIFLAALFLLIMATPTLARAQDNVSRVTRLVVADVSPEGVHNGVEYVTVSGTLYGQVDSAEPVVGLADLPKNAAGVYEYESDFELIAPALGQPSNRLVYVDAENRGRAISQGALGGFLQNFDTTYARIQWQTGISAGVPENAQGVGLVIVRDFARWLAGMTPETVVEGDFETRPYDKMILGGISQSAWFVNTFIAEGFNAEPLRGRRIFDGAIAINGAGNWLAINNIAAERGVAGQNAYVDPDGAPLGWRELLTRSRSDPFLVDVAVYTDFYRLRAGLTSTRNNPRRYRRYDMPAAHVAGSGLSSPRCNDGEQVELNPIGYRPYMRALVLGLMREIGARPRSAWPRLPRSTAFRLTEPPPASPHFNPLPGQPTPVPAVDEDAMPLGGVRFPDVEFPIGRPVPPSLAPAVTTGISATCGNYGGFQPYGRAALDERYGSKMRYLAHYNDQIEWLMRRGFLLYEDRPAMLEAADELYNRWP